MEESPRATSRCFMFMYFLLPTLGAFDVAQVDTDKHQGGGAIGEGTHNPGTPADLAIEAFNDVVRADPRPVLGRKIAVGQRLLNAVLHLLLVLHEK